MSKEELKKKIEAIEITYDYESVYADLYNACIDYGNETQDWFYEGIFEDYIDEEILEDIVKYKIEKEGLWSVQNLLSGIDNYTGIYRIDAYGYGHDIDKSDLEDIKQEILDELEEN